MINFRLLKRFAATALSLSLLTSGTTLVLALSAEPAWANNGNGNGNGSSNRRNVGNNSSRDNSNSSNSNSSNNGNASKSQSNSSRNNGNAGRAISAELSSLTTAHTNPSALAAAAPGTISANLRDYRDSFRGLLAVVDQQNAAYAEYLRISEMSAEQIAATYPSGNHAQAMAQAAETYNALRHNAATLQAQNQASLQRITGGRALSNAAMSDLHVMLGF